MMQVYFESSLWGISDTLEHLWAISRRFKYFKDVPGEFEGSSIVFKGFKAFQLVIRGIPIT